MCDISASISPHTKYGKVHVASVMRTRQAYVYLELIILCNSAGLCGRIAPSKFELKSISIERGRIMTDEFLPLLMSQRTIRSSIKLVKLLRN
jgi:hypothetical protein